MLAAALLVVPIGVTAVNPGPALASSYPFASAVAYEVEARAHAVAIGDVTGDGRADALLATSGFNGTEDERKLLVFAQRADGTLAPPVRYSTVTDYVGFIEVLDTNRDGRLDVVVSVAGGNQEIFRQTSAGTLEHAGLIPVKGSPISGDMDGDGDHDLVVYSEDGLTLLTQEAGGTFTASRISEDFTGEVELGDVTGDGRLDVVAAPLPSLGNGPISVYHRGSAGWTRTQYRTGMTVEDTIDGIEVADVSGDGRADVIATLGANQPDAEVIVMKQKSGGGLASGVFYPVWHSPGPVEAADITGDGRLDVVTLHGGWSALSVLPQSRSGTLGTPMKVEGIPYTTHYSIRALALGDLTGDGRVDAAIADDHHGLLVLRNAA